jgi:hypothetical protein
VPVRKSVRDGLFFGRKFWGLKIGASGITPVGRDPSNALPSRSLDRSRPLQAIIQTREHAAELAGELSIQALRAAGPKQGLEAFVSKADGRECRVFADRRAPTKADTDTAAIFRHKDNSRFRQSRKRPRCWPRARSGSRHPVPCVLRWIRPPCPIGQFFGGPPQISPRHSQLSASNHRNEPF